MDEALTVDCCWVSLEPNHFDDFELGNLVQFSAGNSVWEIIDRDPARKRIQIKLRMVDGETGKTVEDCNKEIDLALTVMNRNRFFVADSDAGGEEG